MGSVSVMEQKHYGICDASAAVALGDFFIAANDEDDILRVYARDHSGAATVELDISNYFPGHKKDEKDIEGASTIGDVTYWITSHGRDNKGRYEKSRFYFFANRMWLDNGGIEHEQYGEAYTRLLDDLLDAESLRAFHFKEAMTLAPKESGGFNIEGLTRTADNSLMIGLRNPIINGRAVLLTIKNPQDVILHGRRCAISEPILLDLHGLGIRSIEYWDSRELYVIIAGSFSSDRDYKLFTWSGGHNAEPIFITDLADIIYNPESIVIYPDINDRIHVLSDDGSEKRGKKQCKKLKNSDKEKYFKSIWLKV